MKTRRITRPTLAELWRQNLATLEALGVDEAPALARELAVAGFTGRPSGAKGILVARSGDDDSITSPDPFRPSPGADGRGCLRRHPEVRARRLAPACC